MASKHTISTNDNLAFTRVRRTLCSKLDSPDLDTPSYEYVDHVQKYMIRGWHVNGVPHRFVIKLDAPDNTLVHILYNDEGDLKTVNHSVYGDASIELDIIECSENSNHPRNLKLYIDRLRKYPDITKWPSIPCPTIPDWYGYVDGYDGF